MDQGPGRGPWTMAGPGPNGPGPWPGRGPWTRAGPGPRPGPMDQGPMGQGHGPGPGPSFRRPRMRPTLRGAVGGRTPAAKKFKLFSAVRAMPGVQAYFWILDRCLGLGRPKIPFKHDPKPRGGIFPKSEPIWITPEPVQA